MCELFEATVKPSVEKPWLKFYTDDDLSAEMPECSMYDYLYESNKDNLDGIALNYFDREISYRELFEQIQKTAQAYASQGVSENDVVIICSATLPEIVYSFYAMDLLGAIPNMVDPRYSPDGIREYIEEVDAKFVCTIDVAYSKVAEAVKGTKVQRVIVVSPAESLPPAKRVIYRLTNPDKNSYADNCVTWENFIAAGGCKALRMIPDRAKRCCVIVHTGGTTGSSKCVMLCDNNFNALAFQFGHCSIKFRRGQRFLNVMPPFIAYGFGFGVHLPLVSGVTSIIIPQLDPKKLAGLIAKYRPEHMAGVPSHYQYLLSDNKLKNRDLSFLVNGCAGGDAISVPAELEVNEFLRNHNCKYPLTKGYGMTELCAVACACMSDINKVGSVGIPLINTTVSVFDPETGKELSYGEKGEICVSGPTMMLGYYDKPEETANVIRRHDDGKLWVHTGDIGHIDEDGFVFIETRMKRVIIRHDGFKVFPSLIENVVAKHPAVEVCAAVAAPDKTKPQGKLPLVSIVLRKGVTESKEQIQMEIVHLCKKELPEYVQPAFYEFRDSMPYTPIGKIDFRALESAAAS